MSAPHSQLSSVFARTIDVFGLLLVEWATEVLRLPPASPGRLRFKVISQERGHMIFVPDFASVPVDLADPKNSDMAFREVKIVRDGQADQVVQYPFDPEAAEGENDVSPEELESNPAYHLEADRGETVNGSLTHIDTSGNRTEMAFDPFVVEDTIGPATPGKLGFRVIAQ